MKLTCHSQIVLVGLFFFCFCACSARANVYATDILLNGSTNMAVMLPGDNLTISYILNDTATGGVWIQICSGTNVIETLASTNGDAGTNAGLNFVVLDDVTNLTEGAYTVSITAASAGYGTWTNITDDSSNFSVCAPRGISVNRNTNSPFYGRVYIGNAFDNGEGAPGDQVGLFKCNADGSPADEGGFSTGGYGWAGDKYSPWKMAIGPDDQVYVDDFFGQGVVLSFDPTIDTNSLRQVIRSDNYPDPVQYPSLQLSGLTLVGAGTNAQIWMTDNYPYGSAGIIGWQLTSNGVAATDDTGSVIVAVDADFLTQAPYDLALGSNNFIYTIQFLTNDSPAYALMSFPPYAGQPETTGDWAISMYPALLETSGVAVDPAAALVALAVLGPDGEDPENNATGGLYLYSTANGDFIANLDQTGGHPYYDVAWDNVGNLYALDGLPSNAVWRVYSPPGTNQATTVAVPLIQAYDALLAPSLHNPASGMCGLNFTLAGQSNIAYVIQRSCDLSNWTAMATNFSTNASRCVCVPVSGQQNFYRAVASH
jgi:hypothetical protein